MTSVCRQTRPIAERDALVLPASSVPAWGLLSPGSWGFCLSGGQGQAEPAWFSSSRCAILWHMPREIKAFLRGGSPHPGTGQNPTSFGSGLKRSLKELLTAVSHGGFLGTGMQSFIHQISLSC